VKDNSKRLSGWRWHAAVISAALGLLVSVVLLIVSIQLIWLPGSATADPMIVPPHPVAIAAWAFLFIAASMSLWKRATTLLSVAWGVIVLLLLVDAIAAPGSIDKLDVQKLVVVVTSVPMNLVLVLGFILALLSKFPPIAGHTKRIVS
jgi:hypothetical protein